MNISRAAVLLIAMVISPALAAESPKKFYVGADISMLPEIEKAGGVFRDNNEKSDALKILRAHGFNLFRARLFVNPTKDFAKSHGATQDLATVIDLAKRIKASGAEFLLDLHYSDTWADPGKQFKPAAWKDLSGEALEKQVHDYTADVLKQFAAAGAMPDMVQAGNEIASGMLWPDGKVDHNGSQDEQDRSWQAFSRLFSAGAKAVREAQTPQRPIRVVIHIHGGGREGMVKWFFGKFKANASDYDVIALSCYPTWDDGLTHLAANMADAIETWDKDVLIAETSYPWKPIEGHKVNATMTWPQSLQGQEQFVRELLRTIRAAPSQRGIGFVWWYPEAIPVKGRPIYRQGAEALFDETGVPLPALRLLKSLDGVGK